MHKTLRSTFSKLTMAAVGIAWYVPHWPTADEVMRMSRDCATAERRQLAFGVDDSATFESDASGGSSVARIRAELFAEGCAIRELHDRGDGLLGEGILSYDPLRKRWQ